VRSEGRVLDLPAQQHHDRGANRRERQLVRRDVDSLADENLTTFDDEGGELRDVLDRRSAADDASPALLSRSTCAMRPPSTREKVLHEEDGATIVNGMPDVVSFLDSNLLSKCGMPVARSAPATDE